MVHYFVLWILWVSIFFNKTMLLYRYTIILFIFFLACPIKNEKYFTYVKRLIAQGTFKFAKLYLNWYRS